MDMKNSDLYELTELVSKFMEFANQLKIAGKISEEQYEYITNKKVEFLRETNTNTYDSKEKEIKKDLFY